MSCILIYSVTCERNFTHTSTVTQRPPVVMDHCWTTLEYVHAHTHTHKDHLSLKSTFCLHSTYGMLCSIQIYNMYSLYVFLHLTVTVNLYCVNRWANFEKLRIGKSAIIQAQWLSEMLYLSSKPRRDT